MRSLPHIPSAADGLNGRHRSQTSLLGLVLGWRTRRRSRRDLATLDPHLLRDIGLTTQEASSEICKPFWRD